MLLGLGLVAATAAGCGSTAGLSNALTTGATTSQRQYLLPENGAISRIGVQTVTGAPPAIADQMTTQLLEMGANHGLILFRQPQTAQPHSLLVDLQAQRIDDRVHIFYRADIQDASGKVVERVKGEEVVQNAAAATATNMRTIKVKKGDSLFQLSRKHGVSIAELMKANNLKNSMIREGQTLKVGAAPPPSTNVWEGFTPSASSLISGKILSALQTVVNAKKQSATKS